MKIQYKDNSRNKYEIPSVVREVKVGDLVVLVIQDNKDVANLGGYVSCISTEAKKDAQIEYIIELSVQKPMIIWEDSSEKVPASKINKYAIINSAPNLDT